jgi:hypothetical protein
MKNAATKNALKKAIESATMISRGEGRPSCDTKTVRIVRIISAPPTNQSCFADEIWCV